MQEGTPAFVQMVRISQAVAAHKDGRPALPRLPAPPHDRRRDGVLGLARPRHRRRARRAGRLPRPAGLRGALRPAVPRGRADRGEPLRPRHHRRGPRRPTRSPTSSTGRSTILLAPREGIAAGRRRPADEPVPDVDTWDAVTRSRRRDRPGVRRLLRYAATDVDPAQRHRAGRVRPRPADRAGAVRRGAVRVPRPGPPRPDLATTRSGPEALREARRGMRLAVRARAAAGDRDRHPGRRPVAGRRERRPGRRDRPLPRRPGDPRRARPCA